MATKDIKKTQEEIQQEKIAESISKTDKFYNDHKKTIWGVIIAIVLIGLAVLAFQKFYVEPKTAEALEQMYPSEASFQNGEYEIALNGDGNVMGFAEVINEYGKKAGQAAYFYAGICAFQNGQYEDALSYLNKYKGKEPILAARAIACKGDCYSALEDYEAAISCYDKAVAKADNVFAATYLLKAGILYEHLGDKAKALGCYETIEDKYPQSFEAYEIGKYIARVQNAE